MKKHLLTIFTLLWLPLVGQKRILVLGNCTKVCFPGDTTTCFFPSKMLPDSLSSYDALLIFSSAHSTLTSENVLSIVNYLHSGKGLYIGCENWPMIQEGNQLTEALFNKRFWGEYAPAHALISENSGLFPVTENELNSGTTAVFFPLDHRLRVEIWAGDEPLLLSSERFGGRLILDGGYSRFYCSEKEQKNILFEKLVHYLIAP
ncbi:MAG: hypothetical protein ACK45H_12135 [Bacteroidota bacterium]|jgi:hypothetical protein